MNFKKPKVGDIYEVFARVVNGFSPYFFYRVEKVNGNEVTLGLLHDELKKDYENTGYNFETWFTKPTNRLVRDSRPNDPDADFFTVELNTSKSLENSNKALLGDFPNTGSGYKDEPYLRVVAVKPYDYGSHRFTSR